MGSAVKTPDLSDAELLFQEAISISEDGDQARALDLLRLSRTLDAEGAPFGPQSPSEARDAGSAAFPPRRTPGALATPDDVDDAELLVQDAIEAAEAGDRIRARDLLGRGLLLDEGNVRGWLWLSGVVDDPEDRAFCLRRVLELDPGNQFAQEALAWLPEQDQTQEPVQPPLHELTQDLRHLVGAGVIPDAETAGVRPAETDVQTSAGEATRRAGSRLLGSLRLLPRSEFALIAVLGLVLLTLMLWANLAGEGALPAPLSLLRLLLGLAFVLFVPGYALQAALFPRNDALDTPERLALSFGLSVALVPVLALILDWLPWGIRLGPIVAAEGLVTILFAEAALLRRWRLPVEDRPALALNLDLKGWWAAQDRTGRVLYGVLAGALLLALTAAAVIILSPTPGEQFTEFYILGSEGLAESYPREAAPGEPLSVTAGIANREGQTARYRIEVQVDGEVIGTTETIALRDGQVWEAQVIFALPRAGVDQQVDFLLYRDGQPEPYRRLRLWINIVEAPGGGAD